MDGWRLAFGPGLSPSDRYPWPAWLWRVQDRRPTNLALASEHPKHAIQRLADGYSADRPNDSAASRGNCITRFRQRNVQSLPPLAILNRHVPTSPCQPKEADASPPPQPPPPRTCVELPRKSSSKKSVRRLHVGDVRTPQCLHPTDSESVHSYAPHALFACGLRAKINPTSSSRIARPIAFRRAISSNSASSARRPADKCCADPRTDAWQAVRLA